MYDIKNIYDRGGAVGWLVITLRRSKKRLRATVCERRNVRVGAELGLGFELEVGVGVGLVLHLREAQR